MDYYKFINSKEWEDLKARYRADLRLPQSCVVCDTMVGLNMHHRTYKRFGGREKLTDLMPLCRLHHAAYHQVGEARLSKDEMHKVKLANKFLNKLENGNRPQGIPYSRGIRNARKNGVAGSTDRKVYRTG